MEVNEITHHLIYNIRIQWVVLSQARSVVIVESSRNRGHVSMMSISMIRQLPKLNLSLFQLFKELKTDFV